MIEQKEELPKEKRAYKLANCVYSFNPFTNMVSSYELSDSGFIFASHNYSEQRLNSFEETIRANLKSKEISAIEFEEFVKKLEVLQEQAHAFKPLVTFDDYINVIRETHLLTRKRED